MGVEPGEAGSSMSVSIASPFAVFVSSSVMILCRREGPSVGPVSNTVIRKRKKGMEKDTLITAITGSSGYGRPGNLAVRESDGMTAFKTASTVGFCRSVMISYSRPTSVQTQKEVETD